MKILQLAPRLPWPADDGGRIGIFGITKYLAQRGHELTLLAITPDRNSDISGLKEYCAVAAVEMNTVSSYRGMLLNLFSHVPYTVSKYHGKPVLEELNNLLQHNRFDIVHVDHLHMARYGEFVKQRFNLPVVLREHNVESVIWDRYYRTVKGHLARAYTHLQFKKFYQYESKLIGAFDRCLAITKKDKERIQKMNPRAKVSVIPAGVDTSYFHPLNAPIERYSLVSVASMDWPPNSDGILWFINKVWPAIKREVPSAKFYVVGKNPPPEIKRLSTKDIIVTGFVGDVREYMARASVLIVPLRTGGGMRIKILNALAMSKAVVSTSVGYEGIDAKDGRSICIADSSEEFAHRTIEVLKDGDRREQLGAEGLKLIQEKYRWEQIAKRIEEEYRRIVEKEA